MYQGKHAAQRPERRRRSINTKATTLVLSLLLLVAVVAGGTVAWLSTQTGGLVNTFSPAKVTGEITEEFDGTTKKNVNIENTGDVDAYVRIKLVTYRVAEDGVTHIGGTAEIPTFTPGDGWFLKDGYYVYKYPVAPRQTPEANLVDSITLVSKYDDADGGKQVIEVMGEAIQALPHDAVKAAWDVSVAADGTLSLQGG